MEPSNRTPEFVRIEDAKKGGFMRGVSPQYAGAALIIPVGREKTAADKRAFDKRVAKRRKRKGYR